MVAEDFKAARRAVAGNVLVACPAVVEYFWAFGGLPVSIGLVVEISILDDLLVSDFIVKIKGLLIKNKLRATNYN